MHMKISTGDNARRAAAVQANAARKLWCAWLATGTLLLASCLAGLPATVQAQGSNGPPQSPPVVAERIGKGPVIYPGMPGLEGELGENIDGPSVIKVPAWIRNPLGKYYMYFAHHRGTYIRLAYADRPEGPWTIYKPGTLRLDQTSAQHHVASPDVLVDEENKRLLLYFHGPVEAPGNYGGRPYGQETFVATSTNGLHFTAASGGFAAPYMKTVRYKGATYGFAMADKKSAYPLWLRSGQFFRSANGMPPFEAGPRMLDEMRHGALLRRADRLHIFYTLVGDLPERILHAEVDLRPDWTEWTATAPTEILRPEHAYEGADLPFAASKGGMSYGRERALRDPAVLDDGGTAYLYYAVAGEKGIAVARLSFPEPEPPAAGKEER